MPPLRYRAPLGVAARRLSSPASASHDLSTIPSPGEGGERSVGQDFQELVFRGRQGRLLAVGDLRKLLARCQTKDHVRYAVQGVELYQRKRHDFSEEVNSHFVSACIRGESPMAAVELFLKPSYRIGAWSTLTSIGRLVDAVGEQGDAVKLKEMLFLLADKGVKFSEDTVFKILTAASKTEAFELTDDLLAKVLQSVHPRDDERVAARLKDLLHKKPHGEE